MADGRYERRGPREAELKRLQRLIDERHGKVEPKKTATSSRDVS